MYVTDKTAKRKIYINIGLNDKRCDIWLWQSFRRFINNTSPCLSTLANVRIICCTKYIHNYMPNKQQGTGIYLEELQDTDIEIILLECRFCLNYF